MDYSKTKIYKIYSHLGDMIYIGSTTKDYLSQRMTAHKYRYSEWKQNKYHFVSSFIIFDSYGVDTCKIELIDAKECQTKDEKNKLEGHYIRTLECVNKNLPDPNIKDRTKLYYEKNKEKITERSKEYRIKNKEKIKEAKQKYCEANKDEIKEKKKEYYNRHKEEAKKYQEENKARIAERTKKYREENKEKYMEQRNKIFECECGSKCLLRNKSDHFKTKKHINFAVNI
jgi:hypothetical protein